MKIVQFVHGLSMGGAETLVKNYALLMHEAGEDVTVLCLKNIKSPYDQELKQKGVKVVYVSEKLHIEGESLFQKVLRRLASYVYVRYFFKKYKPDIIHFHLELSNLLRFAGLPKNTKIFYTHHNDAQAWVTDPKRKNDVNCMKWLIAHYPVQIIALHEQMRDTINKAFNITNTIVLNNGIDMQRFKNARPREVVRDELGIPRDALVVGHVGRFNPVKNHEFLVKIFKAIKGKMHNAFILIIAGGGGGMKKK